MDPVFGYIDALVRGDAAALVSTLIFLATALTTLAVAIVINARGTIRRRVAAISLDAPRKSGSKRSPAESGRRAAERLGEYATRHFASVDTRNQRLLRKRLIQAGFYSPRAVGGFLLARLVALVSFAVLGHFALVSLSPGFAIGTQWLLVGAAGIGGYYLPQFHLDRRIKGRQTEHRNGFPDFMDLMVVCSDAGLSMEAALDRVGRELAGTYPSLSSNIHLSLLELRAGRPLGEALERLGDRLAIEEARSFATLLQQSEELGTSLTETLRVYSDDMRHQRLARAEEKAYSLPAKLAIPLTLCIFPVVMVVAMLPVVVRIRDAGF